MKYRITLPFAVEVENLLISDPVHHNTKLLFIELSSILSIIILTAP